MIVVYKIDRLSRSLMDFARLVEVFDEHKVTFVSVTQSFNTTTSMGRLTLNVLLSFAQFEREVTGERIRDKIAASRAKGMWMGGFVPWGYDAIKRKLVINEAEATDVRYIFERFAALKSATRLTRELVRKGITNKRGRVIDKGFVYQLLRNRVYLGEAVHKGTSYPGEHKAIIDRLLWDKVQSILQVKGARSDLTEGDVAEALATFDGFWDNLFPAEQDRTARLLIERVVVSKEGMSLDLRTSGLSTLVSDMLQSPKLDKAA